MKHGKLRKLLALVLVLCMSVSLVVPAYAAGGSSSAHSAFGRSLIQSWNSFWDKLFGGSDDAGDADLTLVEDETTVEPGTALRASTYALDAPSAQADTTTLKYFPVTLYDYDTTTINNATHQAEVDAGLGSTWNGIYFNGGAPAAESYEYSTGGEVSYTYSGETVSYSNNNNYSMYTKGGYYVDVGGIKYMVTNITCTRSGNWWSYTYSWTITYDGGSTTSSDSSITLYTRKASNTATTNSLSYAAWNWWNKNTGDNDNGQYTYSGLVNSTLDANKNIRFTKPDGGIFNDDATVKTIYTNVDMPFVYEGGTYTFDASQNGAYFYADNSQGSTKAQSNGRLYFNEGNPQSNGGSYGDGSTTVWMPFNSTQNIGSEASCNYHFGMAATIPFTMTANGKMNPNDEDSEDITFSFSGDDDVWVFIDGQLVIDLGGIHNRLDATINFAENTWSLSKSNTVNVAVADYNNAAISGKIFNEGNTTGTLNQTRETFAAKDSHELTIFYLERGAGSSNCKIQFNLPMKDTVSVTKQINQAKTQNADGTVTISPLSASEQAVIDEMDFGFTLYKDNAPVANMNYSLLNVNGQVIDTPSTDANGHFVLKNGQTAKFVGAINSTDGNEYYVVEDKKKGFWAPDYTYTADVANGATQAVAADDMTSMKVQAIGSDEAEDHITFVCKNYMDNELPNPGALLNDDKIVIDYGLPVEIDAFKNDLYRGDKMEMRAVTGAKYGEVNFDKETGKITYQLTEQLTGVEVLTYTVLVTGTAENAGGTENQATLEAEGRVYIIPATSMYYEEDFGGTDSPLVKFTGEWEAEGTAQTAPQEPGVVGTVGDSPYGSDAAYLNDSGDSNGSSMYVDTTKGAASFSYTFTGEGTAFFARTSGTTAYMRVVVTDITNPDSPEVVKDLRRNTIYKAVDGTNVGTLYNIPVFIDEHFDNYGTYKVDVTIMKANEQLGRGSDFYLDGIRVYLPLNSSDENVEVANAAYATDGEANMTVATLREKLLCDAAIEENVPVIDENGNPVLDADGNPVYKTELKWDRKNFVVFTDSNGEIQSAEEYKSNGPKEEVYLNEGQSVSFSLYNWDANSNKIYLGIKAPTGSGAVFINGNTLNITNAADCYYDISSYAEISTDEDGVNTATFTITATSNLISVTNIKVTGNAEFTIVENVDIDVHGSKGED